MLVHARPKTMETDRTRARDFHRDWPANLTGDVTYFSASVGNETFAITVKSNSTVSNCVFKVSKREIHFDVSGPEETTGFCIVTIPKQVLVRPFSVFIDREHQTGILSIQNDTHTSIYFSYDHMNHEVIIIPEFPSLIILPLFMIATLLAVIVYKRKHQTLNKKREV